MDEKREKVILPGETAGCYPECWEKTFDKYFLLGWIASFVGLFVVTLKYEPAIFHDYTFFAFCLLKLLIVGGIAFFGGLLCRHYCPIDKKGYIESSSGSWFKVNYTRKLQHFAAYLVPLINPFSHNKGIIPHLWETLFVMLMFLLMIQPIRERFSFFMIQFNSMDRTEDRPNTLKWIILGNLLPGLILSVIFQQIFEEVIHEPLLVLIVVFIIGIGDGLAEPVGTMFGKKKYIVPSWNFKHRYVRSYVGSACVYVISLISVAIFFQEFNTLPQFITALIIIPPVMTLAEAFAPHSMDTPVLMLIGYTSLYLICTLI